MLKSIIKIFGTKNDKEVKKYRAKVAAINLLEDDYNKLSDDELKSKFSQIRQKVQNGELTQKDILNDVFAIVRETSKRILNMRHFDVQLIGGMVLNDGKIAEMKTGEGKTLVATLPVVLNALSAKGVHVVTVNDYLAKRDAEQMGQIYNFLGLSVGVVLSTQRDDNLRKQAYACDITYGTNNEFGFDYLRDNMCFDINSRVQRGHNYAIVDEVDSILIDEARTPLIISGPTNRTLDGYVRANEVAKQLTKGQMPDPALSNPNAKPSGDFVVDEKNRNIMITEAGIEKAEKLFGVDNLYSLENAALSHYLDQALKAHYLFEKDVQYVVRHDEIIIVDEFTGRLSEGRRFSEGLHQALEAKEGVKIQEESQTLADITFQNYFRLYDKLAGMTGTAQTEASEFSQIYKLDVISIPTNLPIRRIDKNDLIYKTENEKFKAVINEIKAANAKGQPVLVGTASIEKSEILHKLLVEKKIAHSVLNAKNHEKEAQIIEQAGIKGAVTIATNMAGRGVDIRINDEVRELGGLYIIGTERHESRRIDNQLRGRAGRQGDPGLSRFFLSLEDNLLRIFGSTKIKNIMDKLGIADGEHIESSLVTRSVANAQKKVENLHFEARKHILEYDDVANEQRKTIYKYRDELLDPNADISEKIISNRQDWVEDILQNAGVLAQDTAQSIDTDRICKVLLEQSGIEVNKNELENLEYKEIFNKLDELITNDYNNKMSIVNQEQKKGIEKMLYLQIVDRAWREHLYQMDTLKAGIGLRGYNHRDPLTEYKKESFNLFLELVKNLKITSVRTLSHIRFEIQAPQEQNQNDDNAQNNLASIKKKPSRNDLCDCGSGKKYKDCCGKSGPKI